jgi:penicillin-binding protein 1A
MESSTPQRVRVANPADGGLLYWLFKFYVFGGFILLFAAVALVPVVYLAVGATVPPPPNLAAYRQQAEAETHVVSSDGQDLTVLVEKYRYLTPVKKMPPLLIKAFLAAEDRSFYEHGGVDFRGIMRAAWANIQAGAVRQGGSTITQQVAKSFLSQERTIQRKLKEVVLARRIEARFTKDEILYIYLNQVFMGAQAYGVRAAARVYFGKELDRLTVAEAALLAGLVRAPSRYSPRSHPDRAKRRRDQVLAAMAETGAITREQLARAIKEPIRLVDSRKDPLRWLAPHFAEHVRRALIQRYGKSKVYTAGWRVETTVDLPLQRLARYRTLTSVRALDKRQGWRGPWMRIHGERQEKKFLERVERMYDTTRLRVGRPYPMLVLQVSGRRARGRIGKRRVQIPLELASWAAPYSRTNAENERTVGSMKGVVDPGDVVWTISPVRWMRRKAWGTSEEKVTFMALHQVPRVEGALYTYDHQSGYALAMIGGLDYDRSTFNRCTQSCRQPGSTYKPIYYSLALDRDDFSMGTILQDRPYQPEEGEEWNPENVHGTLDGKVTMHTALVRSLNLPSIELLVKVGAKQAAAWARRLGFTTPIHADKALALGASCTKMDELTRAFATFVRGGTQMDPIYIRRIIGRDGVAVEDHTIPEDPLLDESSRLDRMWARSTYRPKQVIDPRTAFLITKLLRDSVMHGIAARCRIVPAPTGGKGGTSSDTMDVWFVGFSSQWAAISWLGDDNYQRPLGEKEASYTSAIPMWANFMKAAVRTRPHRELPLHRPSGIKSVVVDQKTAGPPTEKGKTVKLYFKPGTFAVKKPEQGT